MKISSAVRPARGALLCLFLCFAVLLSGCAPGRDLPPLPDSRAKSYTLGSGDQIRVITFGAEELTREFRVDDQGEIAFPLLGNVKAAGLSPDELSRAIADALKQRKLLRDPSVSIEVVAYRPIFVLGEIAKPGQFAFQPGMTVLTAVAIAGGYTYRAFQDYVSVIRTTGGTAVEGRASPSAFLEPGDVIKVFERHF